MEKDVFTLVDSLINYPGQIVGETIFSEKRFGYYPWTDLPALEEMVFEWGKEHPVVWNIGIGPATAFVKTLTRLLFERTKDIYLYGPSDHITRVKLTPATTASSARHWLAFDVLTQLGETLQTRLPDDIMQLAAEESYFGYGKISDNLMLEAMGGDYIWLFASDESIGKDPSYGRQPEVSPVLERIREVYAGNRHLLLVENLHFPVSLDVLSYMIRRQPSTVQQNRWLISTTSNKDVCNQSKEAKGVFDIFVYHLSPEYYHAPPFHDLRVRDWAMLIKEALLDAARWIYSALQDKGDEEFWMHVAHRGLYYGILYHHTLQTEGAGGHQASNICSVTSDELVRCWVAEDLIFSTARATDIPGVTDQKKSNYYRSAYEAGKVIIQALQEYSLLPVYSASTPAVSTSSSEESTSASSYKNGVTGVSKLAEDVPRLQKDEINTQVKSNQLRWVSFMNDDGRHISWDWNPRDTTGDIQMTTLILRGCSNISAFPLDNLFTPHLRVLDLSYTPIYSLPLSFSNLLNLYLLSLRGCSQLNSLSPPPPSSDKQSSPLAHLENLEVLDMNGVPLIELTQQDGSNKSNLHYLDLSGSKFTTLPSKFFCEMLSLEELIFGKCTNLRELPSSMAQLLNLLVLHVEGTQITTFPEDMFKAMQSLHTLKLTNNMKLMSLPRSLSKAKCLRELHISNCISLMLQNLWEPLAFLENLYVQTWEGLEHIKISGHPNLTTFSISGPWVRCLSLRGCSKLKSVDFSEDLTSLEDVDLSGTAIEEVPRNLPNLLKLRMLLLHGVPYSMRFPWHQLVRFPKIFYLDHCAVDDDNQVVEMFCQKKLCADENAAQININDPRMFHSFSEDAAAKLVKEGQFLQSFYVQVKPCSVTGKKQQNNEAELSAMIQKNSTYTDVQYSEVTCIMPMMKLQKKHRHVEISAVNQYPNGLRHILSVTNTIFITDDNFIRCLTDLNYSLMTLEECQLLHCNQMTVVLRMKSQVMELLESLRILQVSFLKNLLCIVDQVLPRLPMYERTYELITLKLLKHIHLEHCPRLEKMFPCSLSLPALETLVILFCSNLKTIFYKIRYSEESDSDYEDDMVEPSPLPNIKRIYLQELPQLKHFHDDVTFLFETPKWENLFVRGCQFFQHLPLLKKEYPKTKVEVSGDREWWNRLQLKLPEQSDYYLHVAPPEFVSRKKHIIKSYLR